MNVQIKTHPTKTIQMSEIKLGFSNVRRKIDQRSLNEFKESFKQLGVLQPLVVAADQSGGYLLIAGFTRHRALVELGQIDVNVTIIEGDANVLLESHIAENTNRDDLSFVSSIEAIRRLSSELDGDYVEVGNRLGFGKKAMEDRLALTRCTRAVLDSLDDHKIKLGHAVLLSNFTESIQNKTLVKIVAEKWTVELLRERSGKARASFKLAKFDLSGCKGCAHNADTTTQVELFGESVIKGVCSNTKCFSEKQGVWLESERARQIEKVGVLIDVTMMDSIVIHPLRIADVGDAQYAACQSCQHNVSAIDNRLTSPSLGAVRQQLCNNTKCHTGKVSLQQRPEIATTDENSETAPVTKTPPVEQPISATLSNKQQELADGALACFVRDTYPDNDKSMLAVAYLTISKLCKQYPTGRALAEINGKSDKEVSVMLSNMLAGFYKGVEDNAMVSSDTPRGVLHELLFHVGNPEQAIIHSWEPSVLRHYPARHVLQLCKESGFEASYDATHGDQAFSKLKNGTKANLLTSIDEYTFDWTHYAPAAYMSYFSNKYPTLIKGQ